MPETPKSLGEVFADLAAQAPSRPAITDVAGTMDRAELEALTNRLARAYIDLGVTPDSLVTIGLPNGREFLAATLAVWKAGATPQPISHRLPEVERRAIIELAEPSLVVGDIEAVDGIPRVPAGFVVPGGYDDAPLPTRIARSFKAPTSGGSTGRPKLIVATQAAEARSVLPFADLLRMAPDSTNLVTGPLHHNGPFLAATCALLTGSHVVVLGRFDAEATLAAIERHRVAWLYLVPTMMQRIWKLPTEVRETYDVSSLQVAMHMAAPCPRWLKEAWIDWLGADKLLELYAGTEAQAATIITGAEWLAHPGSVGRPVLGEMEVRDDAGQPCPPGVVGEIWLRRGPDAGPTYRYVGADARQDGQGWESLGDLGRVDESGYLYLSDRRTDMIIVGGSNVYPAEVEAALDEHPAVRSSCVVGLPHEDLGAVPHAIVETEGDVSDDDLRAHLAERLAPHKVPRTFERSSEPLRDDAGKVRRSALRAERMEDAHE